MGRSRDQEEAAVPPRSWPKLTKVVAAYALQEDIAKALRVLPDPWDLGFRSRIMSMFQGLMQRLTILKSLGSARESLTRSVLSNVSQQASECRPSRETFWIHLPRNLGSCGTAYRPPFRVSRLEVTFGLPVLLTIKWDMCWVGTRITWTYKGSSRFLQSESLEAQKAP